MNINDLKNVMVQIQYSSAHQSGINPTPFIEVQKDGESYRVIKNGEIIAVFNHAIRAHEFIEKLKKDS